MTEPHLPHTNQLANAVDIALGTKPGPDGRTLLYAIRNMGEAMGALNAHLQHSPIAWPVPDDQVGGTGSNTLWELAHHHLVHASDNVVQYRMEDLDPVMRRRKMHSIREHIDTHALPQLHAMNEFVAALPSSAAEKEQLTSLIGQVIFQARAFTHGAQRIANDKPAFDLGMAKNQVTASILALQDTYNIAEASLQSLSAQTPEAFDPKAWKECGARIRTSIGLLMNDPIVLSDKDHIVPLGDALADAKELLQPIRESVRTGGQGGAQGDATLALARLTSDLNCINAQVSDAAHQLFSRAK